MEIEAPIRRKLLMLAYWTGPLLLLASAITFRLGIGLIPPGKTSYVEGLLGCYGIMCLVPVYLHLSGRLSLQSPTLGAITSITGLCGSVAGVAMEYTRVLEFTLRRHGASDTVWSAFYLDPGGEMLMFALLGPLFPLTSLLLGIGFLRSRLLPRWVCVALILSGIFFPIGQVLELEIGLKVFYPLACLLWAVALPYTGSILLSGLTKQRQEPQM
jgi:hypothetical protein